MPRGTDLRAFQQAVGRILEQIEKFDPAFLIIAAGFDTHQRDPIGSFALRTEEYTEIGRQFSAMGLPTLICQEGGYNVEVLGKRKELFNPKNP